MISPMKNYGYKYAVLIQKDKFFQHNKNQKSLSLIIFCFLYPRRI